VVLTSGREWCHGVVVDPRVPPPTGDVTLLFSDIEGSTRLLRDLGSALGAVLYRQLALCRAAWQAHGGHGLGTEGDSFFVAFGAAHDAVAALVAKRGLEAEPWLSGARVRVRVAIHSGTPQRHGDDYIGLR
jgi:class 3 adenylate cyclase